MEQTDKAAVATAVRDIARHLRDNPQASDSVSGIWRWWLRTSDISHAAVQEALDRLAADGFLEVQSAADGLRRYRLAVDVEALAPLCRPSSDGDAERPTTT